MNDAAVKTMEKKVPIVGYMQHQTGTVLSPAVAGFDWIFAAVNFFAAVLDICRCKHRFAAAKDHFER